MIDSLAALRRLYPQASARSRAKQRDGLDETMRRFIAHAPLCVLASAGQDGALPDASPRFAVVPMALMHDMKVPHEKVNVNGGACALGHPIGASGARIMVTLIHALKAQGKKKGLATLCIGGGEATAVALEVL